MSYEPLRYFNLNHFIVLLLYQVPAVLRSFSHFNCDSERHRGL